MFFKKKKLKEAPLGYWEEQSYMQVIPRDSTKDFMSEILDRVSNTKEFKVQEKRPLTSQEPGNIKFIYKNEEYEIGFYPNRFSVPEYYLNNSVLFSDDEKQEIRNAQVALTIFMKFNKDAKKSYHVQLKMAVAMIPDLIGIIDESAEKILQKKWIKMAAESKIVPNPKDLYTWTL